MIGRQRRGRVSTRAIAFLSAAALTAAAAAPLQAQAPATPQKPSTQKPAPAKPGAPPPTKPADPGAPTGKPGAPPPAKPTDPTARPAAPVKPGAPDTPQAPGAPTAPGERGPQPASPQALGQAIDKLGTIDFPVRMQASRTVRRTPAGQAVPALVQAATKHKDGYVRFRALVLLAGFPDPQVRTVMLGVLDDPNDRLREVAYSYLERNPDPALAPRLLAKLDKETSEFVRPSLTRALAALGTDPKVQQVMLREANRGQDFFRSTVIEALGAHKATYAIAALSAIAKQDGPLQDDAVMSLGRIGDKRAVDTIASLQRKAPRERQPALAAAICLLGSNCDSHERFLVETLTFTIANPGFQDLVRSTANGLARIAIAGRDSAWDVLIDQGAKTVDPVRAPLALSVAAAAVAAPEALLAAVERAPDRKASLELLRDGFDMLEEDFAEEQFYVAIRRTFWKAPEGGPTRKAAESLITVLEF